MLMLTVALVRGSNCWLRSRGFAAAVLLLLPPLRRLPPRPVTGRLDWPGAALSGPFALRRVCHRVVMVRVIGPAPARLDGVFRWLGRNQAIATVADKIGSPRLDQRLAHGKPVCGLEKLHQGTLHFPVFDALRHVNFLLGEGVNSRVVK